MSLIKIVANDITLDFVKETLSIKKENTALSRDFKVAHSTFPFLIVENGNTKKALGTRDLASINKIKTIEVTVFEGGKKYLGELQILSYLSGFRKCNLKYATQLLSIMNAKISSFMPIVSVIPGETDPVPFLEESPDVVAGYANWIMYPNSFLEQGFPDVKWQFPTMKWQNKFGVDLAVDDDWAKYQGEINKFNEDLDAFIDNYYTENAFEVLDVFNKNVPAPQVYLLSPLFYALDSLGFKIEGDFYSSSFIKRLLFQSSKNNLTKTIPAKAPQNIVFLGDSVPITTRRGQTTNEWTTGLTLPVAGDYTIIYSFLLPGPKANVGYGTFNLVTTTSGDSIRKPIFSVKEVIGTSLLVEGKHEINFTDPGTLYLKFQSKTNVLPTSYTLTVSKASEKTFFEMHPTIQLGRYLPDWTFATYLNALQNFFNLEINIDDFSKKMTLNFNENAIATGEKYLIKKSLQITAYEQSPSNAFLLKYDNDEDAALWITISGAATFGLQTSDFSETLNSKFKLVPTTYTAELSEGLDSKQGVGLMIYNQEDFPYTSQDFGGQHLKIAGIGGIYEVYWHKFLKFRLNAASLEMSGPFTEVELNKIIDLKRIFVDNQEYIISDIQYSETLQNNFDVKFNLLSVNF